jgi:hypothetical protein
MQRTLVLCFLLGCAANTGDGGMIVLNNSASAADMCSFTADVNEPFKTNGALFLQSPAPYLLTPLIQSKIDPIMGQELQQTIEFRSAHVDLDIPTISTHVNGTTTTYSFDASELATMHDEGITHFKSLFSGSVGPKGFANVAFDIVPLALLDAIAAKIGGDGGTLDAQIVANIVVVGDLGGDEVDSDLFVYPVTVCTDCIVNPIGDCSLVPTGATVRTGDPCNPFQDGLVDCCTSGNTTVCPAPVPSM